MKQSVYGGSLNYRKVKRPFDKKKLTHVVLKAKLGKSLWLTRFEKKTRDVIEAGALRYGVKIRDIAINRDHIHILFYTKSRESQTLFLRLVSADMGRMYKAFKKTLRLPKSPLWSARPFTRLVSWGRKSLVRIQRYIRQNRDEVLGFVEYKPRRHALSSFLAKWKVQPQLSSA